MANARIKITDLYAPPGLPNHWVMEIENEGLCLVPSCIGTAENSLCRRTPFRGHRLQLAESLKGSATTWYGLLLCGYPMDIEVPIAWPSDFLTSKT